MNHYLIGFFILAICGIRYVLERRAQNRLQEQVKNLLFEYAPLDYEVETITFNDDISINNDYYSTSNKQPYKKNNMV